MIHPAVLNHINGNLEIIHRCLGLIAAALSAEQVGYQSALEVRKERQDAAKTGQEQAFLDQRQDDMIKAGLDSMFDEMKQERAANAQSEFQPSE